jgi:transcriptional regulator with XRE-family HTH domain
MKQVGQNIKAAREARGMTQAKLATLIGWAKEQGDYIGRIEKGRHTPKLETR